MRLKIVLIMWIGMALLSCNVMGTNYRAVYDFEYTKDSINSILEKDILYLEISKNSSFCFSYYTYYTDSLKNTPNGRAVWRQLFSAAIAKDGTNATSFPYKRSTFMVTKCYTSDTLCIKDMIDNDIYEYVASKNEFHWQLCDSTKNINGFEAYKATCCYHGREWAVWFSPDIPFSDGPWVFCGLPGLILEAHDKDPKRIGWTRGKRLTGFHSCGRIINIGKTSRGFSMRKWEQMFRKIRMIPDISMG